jgi:membrane-bound inhibitor of C-type lysozyme
MYITHVFSIRAYLLMLNLRRLVFQQVISNSGSVYKHYMNIFIINSESNNDIRKCVDRT